MSIKESLANALNNQVTMELEAANVYLQLSYILDDLSLTGMRDWMRLQHAEELEHAAKFSQHLLDRGVRPQILDIPAPKSEINSALEAFQAALAHEKKVTASIRELAKLSDELDDYDSRSLLNWFLDEQIEEESTVSEIIDRLEIVGNDGSGLLRIDSELGTRQA